MSFPLFLELDFSDVCLEKFTERGKYATVRISCHALVTFRRESSRNTVVIHFAALIQSVFPFIYSDWSRYYQRVLGKFRLTEKVDVSQENILKAYQP